MELILLSLDQLKSLKEGRLSDLPWDTDGFEMSRYVEKTYGKRIHQLTKKVGLEGWFSFWAIVDQDHLCGLIGFKGYSPSFPEVEVHYAVSPVDQKKGYGSEALKRIITWACGQDPNIKIYARHVRHGNIGSKKVLEACGFKVDKAYETFCTYLFSECFENGKTYSQ